jgi:UPF0755 protein
MKRRHLDTAIFGEPATGQTPDRPTDQTPDRLSDQTTDRTTDQATDQNTDQTSGQTLDQMTAPDSADVMEPASSVRSGESRSAKGGRRRKGKRRRIVLLLALGLVAGAAVMATHVLTPVVSGLRVSNDYTGVGTGSASVVVQLGDTGRSIAGTLQKAGVVKTARAFADAAGDNPNAGSIQPGSYTLHSRMSAASALAMLMNPANRRVPRVILLEGHWTSEVIRTLSRATGRPLAEYQAALKDPAALGLPAAARGSAEGYLFPATYEFEVSDTAGDQLHTMVAKALQELGALGVPPSQMQRVLTIASIVEAEARSAADRPKVARVIVNRLARHTRLQLDTTVSFVSGQRGKVTTTPAQRARGNPYNTYLVAGLPPGPINSPGLSAIKAAISPAPGPWLYFVAVNPDTGETRFAVDAAGHDANVRLFRKWCSGHPGKC